MPLPDPRLSRAILIGTAEFPDADDLPDLPAVRNNITDLQTSLTNPQHGILLGENCSIAINPDTPHAFMKQLAVTARQTNDFLLVYYAGHGVRHQTKDDLYLTTRHTDTDTLNGTAVPLDWVKEEIEHSPARTKLLILDCCYSGLAVGTMSPVIEQRELEVRGSAVIASSPKNAKSHSPVGHQYTAFTGQLVTLLRNGSPNAEEPLTVVTAFRRVQAALARDNFPQPMLRTTGTTSDLLLRRLVNPPPVSVDPPTVRHLRSVPAPQQGVQSPPPAPSVPPTPARTWPQVATLWVFWAVFAMMMVMFLSGLIGTAFARPHVAADTTTMLIGLSMAGATGVPLFALTRRWRDWAARPRLSRMLAVRILLYAFGGLSLIICIAVPSTTTTESRSGSGVAVRAGIVLVGLEGAAACGYHLYRGRRTPT